MELQTVKNILEAILLSVDKPMDLRQLDKLFEADEDNRPSKDQILEALQILQDDYQGRGMELTVVSSGYRIQVREGYTSWLSRLWEEKAPRYSRALLETIVLIAYRQPITRGEIEEIRGVSVSSHIMKTLLEREWVRVLGHKDVPGKPSMYGTTREFLDYFNLKTLDELPPLSDIKDLDKLHPSLELDDEPGSRNAETTESEAGSEVSAEVEAEADNAKVEPDAPDDSYQDGVEDADEDVDEKLEKEKQALTRQSPESADSDESLEESVDQDVQYASEAAETAGPETITTVVVETKSEIDIIIEQVDAVDDSHEEGVEEVDEAKGEKMVQEEQVLPDESSETADMDEQPVDKSAEQDVQITAEEAEITEPETMAEVVAEMDPELDKPVEPRDAPDDSHEEAVEEVDEDMGEQLAQEEQALPHELSATADMDEQPVDQSAEQDVQLTAEEAEITEPEIMAEVVVEMDLEIDKPVEPLDAADDSHEVAVEEVDENIDEEHEQEKKLLASGADEQEPVEELPDQDVQPEPGRRGWSMLAQLLWERLKRLMQKARKRQETELNSGPGLLNF